MIFECETMDLNPPEWVSEPYEPTDEEIARHVSNEAAFEAGEFDLDHCHVISFPTREGSGVVTAIPAGLPTVEKLGIPVIDDDGTVKHIKHFVGGQSSRLIEWVFLTLDGDFLNCRTGEQISKSSFDMAMAVHTPTIEFEHDDKLKKYPASKTLLEFMRGVSAYSTMYRPDIDSLTFEHDNKMWVNSYLPGSVPRADPDWQNNEAWRIVQDHIHDAFPDGAEIIIKWLAHNVQFPGVKILWSPVLVGVEGDGKTTIAKKVLQAAMGKSNVEDASTDELFSDFSAWASGVCVRVLEEIRIDGERRTAIMDKLKPKITNPSVRVVPKGKNGREVVNVTNYIACTNHMDALAISVGDRRYGIWKTRHDDRQAMLAERSDDEHQSYWARLHMAIDDHPGAIRGWLMNIDLSDFDRTAAPPTNAAKLQMVKAAKSPLATDVAEAIELGGEGIAADVVATHFLNARVKELGGRTINSKALSGIMDEAGWTRHSKTVWWKGQNRRLYYRADAFPDLTGLDLSRALRFRLDERDGDEGTAADDRSQFFDGNW